MSSSGKRTGVLAVLSAVFLSILICTLYSNLTSENHIRTTLDHILGPNYPSQASPIAPPEADQDNSLNPGMDSLFHQFNMLSQQMDKALLANNPGFSFQVPNVTVEENNQAYILHVPLQQQEDEQSIHLDVKPSRISISGQFTFISPDGKQTFGSSSFMKSFSPSQEVNPDKITRNLADHDLIITIQKKTPGAPSNGHAIGSNLPGSKGQNQGQKTIPLDIQQQLQHQSKTFI